MASKSTAVVAEIDGNNNQSLHFRPLGRTIRGRFDPRRLVDPGPLLHRFPDGVPGQRIEIDFEKKTGAILEPLQDAEFKRIRGEVDAITRGRRIPEAREEFADIDVCTWHYFLKSAVDYGAARVVSGTMPDHVPGTPQLAFITQPVQDPLERLTLALERQTEMLGKLLEKRGV